MGFSTLHWRKWPGWPDEDALTWVWPTLPSGFGVTLVRLRQISALWGLFLPSHLALDSGKHVAFAQTSWLPGPSG